MKTGASREEVDAVIEKAKSFDLEVQLNMGTDKVVVAILGSSTGQLDTGIFAVLPGVESVTRIMKQYKLASREFKPGGSRVSCGDVEIGGERVVVMAGPCAVESEPQLLEAARSVKKAGASVYVAALLNRVLLPSASRAYRNPDWNCWLKLKRKSVCPSLPRW